MTAGTPRPYADLIMELHQLALDLLATSVEHDEWFRREVDKGRASARAGRLVDRDELVSREALSRLMRVRWTDDAADDLERMAVSIGVCCGASD